VTPVTTDPAGYEAQLAKHRESRRLDAAIIAAQAAAMWAAFTKDEQTLVRFGMFPAAPMEKAEVALTATLERKLESRELAVALMDCASKDGGMRA